MEEGEEATMNIRVGFGNDQVLFVCLFLLF